MIRTPWIALGVTVFAVLAPSAGAAQGAPLRTLVYSVQFSAKTVNEERSPGFSAEGGPAPYGNATTRRTSNVDRDGTLTANVVAAAADGGLVIDVSFVGKATAQPPIRVAVYADRLVYAPSADLSPEAVRILPLLARGIVAGRDVGPGSAWTIAAAAPLKGASTYHVTSLDGDTATFAIDVDMTVPGPKGFDEHGKATAIYDTAKLCPTRYDYTGTSRHQPAPDQYVTTTARVTATLVSDSFGKR
jgi:hypothetical protein